MPSNKPFLSFVADSKLIQRIDDWRFRRRFPSRAKAIRWLLSWALHKDPDPDETPEVPRAEGD